MHNKTKRLRVFHVNLLCLWNEREELYVEAEEEELGPEVPRVKGPKGTLGVAQPLEATQLHQIRILQEEFQDVFSEAPGCTSLAEHRVETLPGVVVRSSGWNWPWNLYSTIDEVSKMLRLGVIEPSSSPWWSNPVVVAKPDGSMQFCIDLRQLNAISKFDAYPMPKVDDLLDKLGGAWFLSSLDLTHGYWQIAVGPSDREKTVFVSPRGLFQFVRMPFGLHGVSATFQRLMDMVLEPVRDCAATYIDDIIIYSHLWKEHLGHLRRVLSELRKANLHANPQKCRMAETDVRFLGFSVGQGEIQPQDEKVEKVSAWPRPIMKRQVQQFLGLAGYYQKFIPNYGNTAAPSTDLTCKKAPQQVKWEWEEDRAFMALKRQLCEALVRHPPDFKCPFILQTDVSGRGRGAVLAQETVDEEHVGD